MNEPTRRWAYCGGAWIFLSAILLGSTGFAQTLTPIEGAYLDLENISPNNVLGSAGGLQQAGGLFVQGGFVCAVSLYAANSQGCNSGGGGVANGYLTLAFNAPGPLGKSTLPDNSLIAPLTQLTLYPPAYTGSGTPNTQSVAFPTNSVAAGYAALGYANGNNQIGFTLATNSVQYGLYSRLFPDGTSVPDLVGSTSFTPNWVFNVFDTANNSFVAPGINQFMTTGVNCAGLFQAINLLNCQGALPPLVPFPQNVSYSLSVQANSITTPTFSWTQPNNYTPDVLRIEIWQINGAGAPANQIFNATLSNTTTSFIVPSTFTNLYTQQPGSLQAGQQYALDLENITLRNPASTNTANDNVWSRSRSFFDFTPTAAAANLPVNTPISIPVNNPVGTAPTFVFNQSVTPGTTTYIDPPMATGYVFQTGSTDPNFTSVTPVSIIGTGVYQLYTPATGGGYVFTANIRAGQTYTFAGSGVRSFEIQGIPASANVDPLNTSAFITGLTFGGSGQFTGTMTPIEATAPAATTDNTSDGPIPLWALGALGAGLLGMASRRIKKAA